MSTRSKAPSRAAQSRTEPFKTRAATHMPRASQIALYAPPDAPCVASDPLHLAYLEMLGRYGDVLRGVEALDVDIGASITTRANPEEKSDGHVR